MLGQQAGERIRFGVILTISYIPEVSEAIPGVEREVRYNYF